MEGGGKVKTKETQMEIIIPLPDTNNFDDRTYKGLKGYLKQIELAVHHAQKSIEQFEKDEVPLTEDSYVLFENPFLRDCLKDAKMSSEDIERFIDNNYSELQSVQLRIVIQ